MKNNNDSLYTVYQILTGLFKLSEKIINIKKKLIHCFLFERIKNSLNLIK